MLGRHVESILTREIKKSKSFGDENAATTLNASPEKFEELSERSAQSSFGDRCRM